MPLDFPVEPDPRRVARGSGNHHAGLAAEDLVFRHYATRGHRVAQRRWRGRRGEIDMVVDAADGTTVFVEVKHGPTHDAAADHLRPAQLARIRTTAEEYVGGVHGHLDVEMRFDLALVDRLGRIEVIEGIWID